MANIKTDDLTLPFGGVSVRGRQETNLDTGKVTWRPYNGIFVKQDNYLISEKQPDGKYKWTPVGDVFGDVREFNSSVKSQYSTTNQVANEFYTNTYKIIDSTINANWSVYGVPQTAQRNQWYRGSGNTQQSGGGGGGNGGTGSTLTPGGAVQSTPFADTSSSFKSKDMPLLSKGTYRYPLNLGNNTSKQDYIKFDIIEYGGRSIGNSTGKIDIKGFFGERNFGKEEKSSVILPIQSGINDENSVQWGGEDLDAVSAYFAGKSFSAINQGLNKTLEEVYKDVDNIISKGANSPYATAMKTYLAGQAVGTNNLLSRTSGAIINPNLELLFQGPTLRPFNFNFRLSPRGETEAEQVKKIIRVFKEASAVRNTESDLFLKSPHVFRIKYIDGSSNDSNDSHKSINLIKECALLSFSVNYTPENTYMTFNDSEHTMVSYELTMRFSELEPVTSQDYINQSSHSIGY